jgi:16S rRNA (cytosine967-C5)-methyltransferase
MALFQRIGPPTATERLHPALVRVVINALQRIFGEEKQYADKVIESELRNNPKAGSRDRAFIAETTYEIVRYYRLYSEVLAHPLRRDLDYWELIAIHWAARNQPLPDWNEFKHLVFKDLRTRIFEKSKIRAIRESIPDWIDEAGAAELGDAWDDTLHHLNQPAEVVLRANRLRTDRDELRKVLLEEGIDSHPVGAHDALQLAVRKNVFNTAAFKKGWFEVQDYSSQQVAPMLDIQPGMRVVDACAGGGGKTLHLAALLQNKGSLIAMDTLAWKLDELRLRARRAGATNIETRPIENRKVIKRLYGTADRLLLDVPCSGLGVLRRNPDSKWKLTAEFVDNLRTTQQDILRSYSPIVKPGGRMVYATCSILPSENTAQVAQFLASEAGQGWSLVQDKSILPQDEGFDGFYMALLERSK